MFKIFRFVGNACTGIALGLSVLALISLVEDIISELTTPSLEDDKEERAEAYAANQVLIKAQKGEYKDETDKRIANDFQFFKMAYLNK